MSSEIKNTINLLCTLINMIYKTNLKREYFRLAKFNKTEENIVPILWKTLCAILNENNITLVKRRFQSINYNRKEFYQLNAENNHGSRELLLALAFLLSVTLEKHLKEKLENIPDPFSDMPLNESCNIKKFNWKKLKDCDLQNYRKWLAGTISFNNNKVLDYKEQIAKIQCKYNKSLDIKAHSSLTIYEIMALKNKNVGEQFIQHTESVTQILTVYVEWAKKEKQFWKWMDTVLEETK